MAEQFLTLMARYCEEDQKRISIWYEALQKAGFRGTQTPNLPHHISLATFPVEQEKEAIAIARKAAMQFAPVEVAIRHVGILPGGKVLFAAPDLSPALCALQAACEVSSLNGYPFTPHTTLLIDEPEVIGSAVPVLMKQFTPIPARIDHLHLCAFWPTREILDISLSGAK